MPVTTFDFEEKYRYHVGFDSHIIRSRPRITPHRPELATETASRPLCREALGHSFHGAPARQ
ncbi:hypothetical protein CTA2_12694 [Colletotrichum tanaceti]|nr:hypothetical protein CTA2_12694 [Colletotrichum tanaceti]